MATQAGDPELRIVVPQDSAFVGDTIVADILLGDMSLPVDSIYGIAFRVLYDPALIDSASARIDFDPSWIGTPSQTLSLSRDSYSNGFIDGGIVRIDGNNATASFVLIDNIEGKRLISELLPLQIGSYTAIDAAEQPLVFSAVHDTVLVQDMTVASLPLTERAQRVEVFPNPSDAEFQVRISGAQPRGYRLSNLHGVTVLDRRGRQQDFTLSVADFPAGIYILSIDFDAVTIHKKLVKKLQANLVFSIPVVPAGAWRPGAIFLQCPHTRIIF